VSYGFSASTSLAARKAHLCACCGHRMALGTRHLKMVGKWQGDFYAERMHEDCYGLWNALFDDWGDPWGGMQFDLADVFCAYGDAAAAQEALNAQRGFYPHAVCRLEYRLRRWLEGGDLHSMTACKCAQVEDERC
jgi:hypothetical protein